MTNFSRRTHVVPGFAYIVAAGLLAAATTTPAQELPGMRPAVVPAGTVDRGALPSSQPLTVTLRLAPTAERQAALAAYLTQVQTPGSALYHQWLTPAQFGQSFGATSSQLAEVNAFAQANGLAVGTPSASGLSVSLSGSVGQIEAAMAPGMHQMQLSGSLYYANTAAPSLTGAVAKDVADIAGLSTLPNAHPIAVGSVASDDTLSTLSAVVDANTTRLVSLSGAACLEDVSSADAAAMQMVLRQAAAEGITVLAQSGCNGRGSASYPAAFSEVMAVAVAPGVTPAVSPVLTELRPAWQAATGLPADGFRHEPDFTVSTVAALTQTFNTILASEPANADGSAARLGNVNATIYGMDATPGLFTQPDNAAAPTWESATGLGAIDLTTLAKFFPRGATATTTVLTLSPAYTIALGTMVNIYATVTSGGTPVSGSNENVTIASGSTVYNSTTLQSSGQTPLVATALAAGTYNFTATYQGDNTYAGSTSSTNNNNSQPTTVTVQQGTPSLVYVPPTGNPTFGTTMTMTLNVQGVSAFTPTGNVTLTIYGINYTKALTASTVAGTATVSFTVPATQAGSIPLSFSYAGDTNYVSATKYPTQQVGQATVASTSLTVSPTTPVYGQQTTLTASFTGAGTGYPAPTGYVQITDTTPSQNAQYVGGGTLGATNNGVLTVNSSTISGTVNNAFTASYQGDTNYQAATASASTNGSKITSSISVNTPTRTTVVTGGQLTLTATLTLASAPSGLNPTGTVQFYSNGAQLGQSVQVSSGTGIGSTTITVTSSPITFQTIGTDAITVTYSGDSNYSTSTSTNPVTITVGPTTSIALTSSATNNVTFGGNVTITATVNATPTSGANTPTGNLIFSISGGGYTTAQTQTATLSSTANPSTTATAATTFASLPAGSYSITATCSQTNFDCTNVTINTVTVTVSKSATTTTITSNPSSPTAGQTVTLTSTTVPNPAVTGAPAFTGSVTFYDNGTQLCAPTIFGSGTATCTGTLSGTNDTVTAVYSGDSNYTTSTGTLTLKAASTTTSTTVTSNVTTALFGANIVLTASVSTAPTTANPSPGTPTGTVTFYDTYNGQQVNLGTATLTASGPYLAIGQISTTGLLDGTHNIVALFGGSSSYLTSTSTSLTINIYDYGVSFAPSSLTLNRGSSGSSIATITAINGFKGQVVLGCTPPAATLTTCSFSPAVINGSGTAQLLITTTPPQLNKVPVHAMLNRTLGGVAVATLLFGFLLPGSRRRRPVLLALLVSSLMLGSLGCTTLVNDNAGSGGGSTTGGTPLGTLIFTVTTSGTDGLTTTQHNLQMQVTVQ